MGFFRFRRRIKLVPHVWFNFSKTGISTSIGGKGVTVNLSKGKVKTTYSVPGTGLSYIQTTRAANDPRHQVTSEPEPDHRAITENPPPSKSKIPVYIFLLLLALLVFLLVK